MNTQVAIARKAATLHSSSALSVDHLDDFQDPIVVLANYRIANTNVFAMGDTVSVVYDAVNCVFARTFSEGLELAGPRVIKRSA
jgi:hypothetical protein